MAQEMPSFDPASVETFRFVSYDFDETHAIASLHYAFDDQHTFTERFTFEGSILPLDDARRAALDRSLAQLHLMAGISYYKAAVPKNIVVETGPLTKDAASFFEKIYLHGLGEFAHINGLNLHQTLSFPFEEGLERDVVSCPLPRKTAVPVGGGKDSLVTIEALKQADEPMVLFSIGAHKPIVDVAGVSGVEHIIVKRALDPHLFALNKQGAYNGHVPISAIIAFVLAVSSVLYGFDRAALSNERSANVGNFEREDGFEVNHQYSKSLTFERDLHAFWSKEGLGTFRYFSFLRPLSELHIAQLFARYPQYHSVFTSCNKAFRLVKTAPETRWCLDCPKCRFTFLAIAPALAKEALLAIYGANLLDMPTQQEGFDELIGVSGHKPFECVGEVEECVAAFCQLATRDEWKDALLVKRFIEQVLPQVEDPSALIERMLTPSQAHHLEPYFEERFHAAL